MTDRQEIRDDLVSVLDSDSSNHRYDDESEASYEVFEPGNPWTQRISTQAQRQTYRRNLYLQSDDDVVAPPADCTQNQSSISFKTISATNSVETAIVVDDDDDKSNDEYDDEVLFESSTPRRRPDDECRGRSTEVQQPWWSNGKIAPLLRDFDGSRRSFYMAQAGISSSAISKCNDTQMPSSVSNTPLPIGSPASTSSVIRPTLLPVRKALSLAGNANSPSSGSLASIDMTPRKKTWNATWGEKGNRVIENSSTPSSSNKKGKVIANAATPSRRGGRGKLARGRGGKTLGMASATRREAT